jgi:hypothetical protein
MQIDPLENNVRLVGRCDDLRKHRQVEYRNLRSMAEELYEAVAAGNPNEATLCIVGFLDRELSARDSAVEKSTAERMRSECEAWRRGVLDAMQHTVDKFTLPR